MRAERNQFQDYLTEAGVSIVRGSGLPIIHHRISGSFRNIISYDDSLIVQLIPRADAIYNCRRIQVPGDSARPRLGQRYVRRHRGL